MWWLIAGLGIFSCIGIVFILRYHRLRNSINQMRIQLEEILENPEDNRILLLDYFQEDLELFCKTMNDYIQINQKIRILQRNKEKKLRMQIESISHDLRTPLTSMLGYLSFVDRNQLDQDGKEALEVIKRKGKSLQGLICNFYDLSRLETNDYQLFMEKMNLSRFLKENFLSSFQELEDSGLKVQIEMGDLPVFIMADLGAMERICHNMVQNAMRYGETYFRIVLKKEENSVFLLFENDTYSLKQEDVPYLFERFYRKEKSRTKQGTGLGLTIAKLLTEAMGGSVEAKLEGEKLKMIYEFPFM